MSDIQFKKGDLVQLKSGGPIMTIENIGEYGSPSETKVKCTWFNINIKVDDLFYPDTLTTA